MAKSRLRAGDAAPMVILELTGAAGQVRATTGARKSGSSGGDRAKRVAQSARKAQAAPPATVPAPTIPEKTSAAAEPAGEFPAEADPAKAET
jgi:hypothetical protein